MHGVIVRRYGCHSDVNKFLDVDQLKNIMYRNNGMIRIMHERIQYME